MFSQANASGEFYEPVVNCPKIFKEWYASNIPKPRYFNCDLNHRNLLTHKRVSSVSVYINML